MTTDELDVAVLTTIDTKLPESSGILDTPITWETVEKDFQDYFGTKAKIGDGRHAQRIGEGNGFVSCLALVNFDWTEDEDLLPATAVLKITGFARLKELCESVFHKNFEDVKKQSREIHNNELAFYELVRDEWKLPEDVLKTPKFYTGRKFVDSEVEAGYIAMEHIDGGILRHMYHTVQPSSVVEVLKIIAKLGAISLKNPDTVAKFNEDFILTMFKDFFDVESVRKGLPLALTQVPECGPQIDVMYEKVEAIADMNTYIKVLEESCSVKMQCHGDLWAANMMWDKDSDGVFHIRGLIDWQITHLGSPVEDLCRFLCCVVSSEDKKKNLHFFLETYFNTLKEECGDQVEVPFTFEKLVESYEKLCPLVIVPFLPFMGTFAEKIFESLPENEQEEARAVFKDKVKGMLEDAAEYIQKWY